MIRVLIVEDDPNQIDILTRILTGSSFEVVGAARRIADLDNAYDPSPDVVLLDLDLPETRGMETIKRAHDRFPLRPIVVHSGASSEDVESIMQEAVKLGVEDILPKGEVTAEVLKRSLQFAVERRERQSAEEHIRQLNSELASAKLKIREVIKDLKGLLRAEAESAERAVLVLDANGPEDAE